MSAGENGVVGAASVTVWRDVAHLDWWAVCAELHSSGLTYLDLLTAIDRVSEIEVLAVLANPSDWSAVGIRSRVPVATPISSLSALFPAAVWHERETSEMFGIAFDGLEDTRPLLRRETLGAPPLLKSVVLAARVAREWPGAAEPEVRDDGRRAGNPSKRRQRPAGVPADWWNQP